MSTYKDRMADLHYYVLQKDGTVLGTFGNLKKVVSHLESLGVNASYDTLIRKKSYPVDYKGFSLFYVKHK